MSRAARNRLVSVLDREYGNPAFCATTDAEPGLLDLQVAGIGPVKFPITPTQVRKLRALGNRHGTDSARRH